MLSSQDKVNEIREAIWKAEEVSIDLGNPIQLSSNANNLAKRIERKLRTNEGQVLPIYIVVTSTTREYGGPEEGGWWYNWTVIEEVRKAWDAKTALKYVRAMKEDYPQPRFGIYSAANNGEAEHRFIVCSDPSFFEDLESTERPYYS